MQSPHARIGTQVGSVALLPFRASAKRLTMDPIEIGYACRLFSTMIIIIKLWRFCVPIC